MPYMPDWLGNMTSTADGLIDDSPQLRQTEQETQKQNLHAAASDAVKQVQIKNKMLQAQAKEMEAANAEKAKPVENPMSGSFASQSNSNQRSTAVPPPEEFDIQRPPGAEPPPQQDGPEDPVQSVHHIAQTMGLTPQQVAAITMLGQDARTQQEQELAQQNIMQQRQPVPQTPPPPPMLGGPPPGPPGMPPQAPTGAPVPPGAPLAPGVPAPMPTPLTGPPAAPTSPLPPPQ